MHICLANLSVFALSLPNAGVSIGEEGRHQLDRHRDLGVSWGYGEEGCRNRHATLKLYWLNVTIWSLIPSRLSLTWTTLIWAAHGTQTSPAAVPDTSEDEMFTIAG